MNHRSIHLMRMAAAFLALAALYPAPAMADLIEVKLQDATYNEQVEYSTGPYVPDDVVVVAKGQDSTLPENVGHTSSYSKGPFTFRHSGGASTASKGPSANAAILLSTTVNDPNVFLAEGTSWEHRAVSRVSYQVAVVNLEGTTIQHVVPVLVRGSLMVSGSGQPGSPWDLLAYAAVGLNEDDNGYMGASFGHVALEMDEKGTLGVKTVPFVIPVPVAVGQNRGDFFHFWVWEQAIASLQVHAQYGRDFPDYTLLGSGAATAWADPYFYIDPTWEFADSYGLVFSPGVENAVPEPGGAALMLTGVAFLAGVCSSSENGFAGR